MLKKYLTAPLFLSLVSLINEVTFATPLPNNYSYPTVPNSTADTLVCYAQMEDGKTLDLSQLCRYGEVNKPSGTRWGDTDSNHTPSNSSSSSTYPDSSYAPITYSDSGYAPSK